MQASDLSALKAFPPRTVPGIIALRDLMKQYAASFPVQVTIGYCMVYLCLQTFAVPGTLSLSLLSGALYGTLPGLLLVSGTLIGCLPNNFVAVSAGSRLGELVSLRDLYDRRLLLLGLAVSFMALLPIVLKNMNALPQTAEAEAKMLKRKQQ
ncbi:TPA: hypothetical protein ACH3X3_004251 [Trebouxia sp. C0006]